jgi:D-glycero-D-manno-heptose 1,7-bisphosphate phosphatase
MPQNKALFLDRDGTLIRDAHYLKDPEKVEIIQGISEALGRIKQLGYLLFMHTNQSGIARGYYDWNEVHACNQKMFQDFGWDENFFDEICIAPESPNETEVYRKPSPKFELEMIKKFNLVPQGCWVVGDKWIDPQTGLNASMKGALVQTGKPIDENLQKKAESEGVPIYKDLAEFAAKEILLNV